MTDILEIDKLVVEIALIALGLIVVILNAFKKEVVAHAPFLAKFFIKKIKAYDYSKISKTNSKVISYLEIIAQDTKAARVAIYQLSNGKHYFSGQPMLRADVTDVHIKRKNVTKIPYIPFNIVKCLLEQLVKTKIASFKETGCDSNESFLSYYEISDCILYRLDIDNRFIGFIEILDPQNEISEDTISAAERIGGLFEAHLL